MSFPSITGYQTGGGFGQVLAALKSLGFYEYLLPWLFTFAVVFGLLSAVGIFGGKESPLNRRISAALALVVAFFVTGYAGPSLSAFFITLFGGASIIIAGILVVILFVAMVGTDIAFLKKQGIIIALIIIGIVLWFLSVGAASGLGIYMLLSTDLIALILVIVIIVMAVWMIVKEEKPAEKPK
jgi:hypothetical protein